MKQALRLLIATASLSGTQSLKVESHPMANDRIKPLYGILNPTHEADKNFELLPGTLSSSAGISGNEMYQCLFLNNHLNYQEKLDVHSALNYAWELFGENDNGGILNFEKAQSVATVLSRLDVERDLVIAGILHCALGNKYTSPADIESLFGTKVYDLVENVDQIMRVEKTAQSFSLSQSVMSQRNFSGNLINLILCVSNCWDSLFLKIVLHLTDLLSIHQFSPKKRKILARQALDVYAPLAHRMGANNLKNELESLGFQHLYPRSFKNLSEQLKCEEGLHSALLTAVMEQLHVEINSNADFGKLMDAVTVTGRCKEPYSLWRKMVRKSAALDRITDAVAVRIIISPSEDSTLSEEELCYLMQTKIQQIWPHVENRDKDYINSPKENGYQSLHCTVEVSFGESVYPVEIQVRTSKMHQTAEYGKAAHFTYKEGLGSNKVDDRASSWATVTDGRQLIQSLHNDLRQSKVFVFGPNGDVLDFERGATLSDVRKQLIQNHRNSGHKSFFTSQTKINGKRKGQSYTLDDGDILSLH
mmetsp:Transcript_415/g.571  ORF Transcript_415/g.571 Transcript_415/m.571 type:complete len:532 (+) Transcript_415:175-1770(+)